MIARNERVICLGNTRGRQRSSIQFKGSRDPRRGWMASPDILTKADKTIENKRYSIQKGNADNGCLISAAAGIYSLPANTTPPLMSLAEICTSSHRDLVGNFRGGFGGTTLVSLVSLVQANGDGKHPRSSAGLYAHFQCYEPYSLEFQPCK